MNVYLSDQPLSALVRDVLTLDGYLAPGVAVRSVLPLANAPGMFGSQVTLGPRTITVTLDLFPDSLPERATVQTTILQAVGGLRPFRTEDQPDVETWVVLTGVSVDFYHPSIPRCAVQLTFTAADPTRYEREARVVALSTSRATCPIGSQPVAPRVFVYGGCTNPVVLVRNAQGDETHRLTLTGVLASTDYLDIDAAKQTIDLYVSGTLQTGTASGNAWLSSGEFPLLAPEDAIAGDGITIELTSSSGTPTGLALYQRGY